MPRLVELQNADGTPLTAFDFGTVLPGTSSEAKVIKFKNTGDVTVAVRAWVENVAPTDGTLSLTFGGVSITGTDIATANVLGTLAAAAELTGTATYVVPGGSEGVMQAQSLLKFQYA